MRDRIIQIRVRIEEKAAFERAAELAGVSLSAWVRERLRSWVLREVGPGTFLEFRHNSDKAPTEGDR